MQLVNYIPLVFSKREDVPDEAYYGCAFLYSPSNLLRKVGDDCGASFFMRSLSKPIQASLMQDFDVASRFNFSDKEIAITCASHSGTYEHIALVRSILNKADLDESYLKCPAAKPLDERDFDGNIMPICNNCSAKHALMLVISKLNGWDLSSYTDVSHPIQKLIYKRHLELSGASFAKISFDGCSAPVFALKIDEIAKMFFNFFNDEKYFFIRNAMVKNPYIMGGFGRLDTKIIELGNANLVAKVGAGGFVLVFNIKDNKILIVKMSQNNNLPREIAALNILYELGWISKNPSVQKYFNDCGQYLGDYVLNFSFL